MNKKYFFEKYRLLFGKLNESQVYHIELILDYFINNNYKDLRWLAYMLATVYHETDKTFKPIEEYGKGKGKKYGSKIKLNGKPYSKPDHIYYGRGLVQLTWYENYELLGRLLKVDLLNNPNLALDPTISIQILFEGMTKSYSNIGDFTGKSLEIYFNSKIEDPINARKIINGLDKAKLISDHYYKFKTCLNIK